MGKSEGSAAPWPQPEFSAPSATALRKGQVYRTGRPSVKLHGGTEGPAGAPFALSGARDPNQRADPSAEGGLQGSGQGGQKGDWPGQVRALALALSVTVGWGHEAERGEPDLGESPSRWNLASLGLSSLKRWFCVDTESNICMF